MTTSSANKSVFRGFFEKQKLTGPNFIDWYRQLRIVLSIEDKLNYLEQPLPPAPVAPVCQQVAPEILTAHTAWVKGSKEIGYIDNLERLGNPVILDLAVSLILIGLRKEFDGFVQNYNMHSLGKTVNELHAMLKLHEQTLNLPKNNAPALHAIRAGKVQKGKKHNKPQPSKAGRGQNQGNGKHKHAFAPKPKIPPPPKREDPAKDSICHECGETGHWKRNCPQYLAELLKKKKNTASGAGGGSGIFVIELNTFLNRSWIYDTGCGTHICNTTQGLRASRKLNLGALSLYVGNGQREAIEAIDVFYLCLPSGLEIVLNNCHYAPSITRGVISVSHLYEDDFINRFMNNTIQVSRNNMIYFSVIPRDGIFEIELSNSYANDSSIYTVSNKRAKLDLDSALLWHCRLGHISKKRIEKLQHDGLLNSTDLRAFEKCVPCMSGKMARKPYTHQVERAKDLLGLIHTDVCGPFKITSRQGASYFVTFTDDFSRYGYVYLLKHKHEVFETFKVFQKEVENQLGKTIKSLRSDRGGEYMSQEFLDHLKDHGIIAHRTPPYTPQHNGVSERRNRTLLDMVRSMMSQTTLPKSFWDYALETAARILNMVPTKKVEKTPYEVWHGQAPKLSYLKVWGCEALVKRDTLTKPDKLEPRSIKCIFIGYPKETMGVFLFTNPPENKDLVARDTSLINEKDDLGMDELKVISFHSLVHKDTLRSTRSYGFILDAENMELGNLDLDEAAYFLGNQDLRDRSDVDWLNHAKVLNREENLKNILNGEFQTWTGDLKRELRVSCYTDVGYLTDADDLKSQTGYVFVLNEAEYIAAYDASKEVVWVRKFISGLGVVPIIEKPINMYCDNTRAIAIAKESGITKGARHFRAKVHYLREVIEFGDIKLEKIHTDDNLADPFTKSLAFPKHSEHTRNIGMFPASSLM
ncbi:retrotransposon protein, putative, ty1-copia subclass [Tanacetum coccineum]